MKAIDTVPHEHLLYKISRYGIKDPHNGWIRSYFSNRTHCVMINGCKSESVPDTTVVSGISKVGDLGPSLFVIYINDLPDSVK